MILIANSGAAVAIFCLLISVFCMKKKSNRIYLGSYQGLKTTRVYSFNPFTADPVNPLHFVIDVNWLHIAIQV